MIDTKKIMSLAVRISKFLLFQYFYRLRQLRYFILRFKTKSGTVTRYVQGSKMQLHLDDGGISADLALDGIREPLSTKTVHEEVREGYTVVDIGANIGYYALMESGLAGKKGKVYAIEPSQNNFSNLVKNIKLLEADIHGRALLLLLALPTRILMHLKRSGCFSGNIN